MLPSRTPKLAVAAQAGALAFLACLLALHALTLRSLPWYMSEYANSPYRAVFLAGGYAFVLALASLSLGLSRVLPQSRRLHLGLVALTAVVPFAFMAVTFPVDDGDGPATLTGRLHDWATIPMFLFLNAAQLLLAPGLQAAGQRCLARLTLAAGVVAALAAVGYVGLRLAENPFVGVAQRVLVGTGILWTLVIGRALWIGWSQPVAAPAEVAGTPEGPPSNPDA